MSEDPEEIIRAMSGLMGPSKADVDPEDELETALKMSLSDRVGSVILGYSSTLVLDSREAARYIESNVQPEVDRRKAKKGYSLTIGTLRYRGDGTILGHEIDPEYQRPGGEEQ